MLVVVAFELKTPDLERKRLAVEKAFTGRFGHLLITVHEVLPRMEIAGGCSNKNFALRSMTKFLNDNLDNDLNCFTNAKDRAVTVTTCDTDSLFHPNYFEALEHSYNEENPSKDLNKVFANGQPTIEPKLIIWQSPVFYNWDLDKRPFFNRTTGIMRSMMMLGGLISFNLNPMSKLRSDIKTNSISKYIYISRNLCTCLTNIIISPITN